MTLEEWIHVTATAEAADILVSVGINDYRAETTRFMQEVPPKSSFISLLFVGVLPSPSRHRQVGFLMQVLIASWNDRQLLGQGPSHGESINHRLDCVRATKYASTVCDDMRIQNRHRATREGDVFYKSKQTSSVKDRGCDVSGWQ